MLVWVQMRVKLAFSWSLGVYVKSLFCEHNSKSLECNESTGVYYTDQLLIILILLVKGIIVAKLELKLTKIYLYCRR